MTGPAESALACPGCGAARDDSTNFCGRCGTDLRLVGTAAPATAGDDPFIGRVLDGRYRVLERIGRGGMGAVYRVEHLRLQKVAAMKILHAELAADRHQVRRFRREAEAISRLSHPAIVQVFDFGHADGATFIVMEHVRGENLGALVRRDGTIPYVRAAPIFTQICGALAEAHEAGVVHRDLKPENVVVARRRDGADQVKVLDFGLARVLEQPDEPADVTARGDLVGTPYYMAPEQVRGEEPTAATDLYALGALMYRVLVGEPPFSAPSAVGVLTKHLTEEPVAPRQRRPDLPIGEDVEAIVLRALAKRPEERFASAEAMRAAIEASLVGAQDGVPVGIAREGSRRRAADSGTADAGAEASGAPPRRRRRGSSLTDGRIRREDWDDFERTLRRGRTLRLLAAPVALAALGALAWGLITHPELIAGTGTESEPNDEASTADLIADGEPVRGFLGRRVSREVSDRDFFRLRVPTGRDVLRAELGAVPNIDLVLELFDAGGRRLARADGGGVGEPEAVANAGVGGGDCYLVVREVWIDGQPPTENATDGYALVASTRARAPDEEREPNDAPDEATPLLGPGRVRAFAGRPGDVDRFRLPVPAALEASVAAPDGVALRLRLLGPDGTERARADGSGPARAAGVAELVVERIDPPGDPPRAPVTSLLVPYVLEVR